MRQRHLDRIGWIQEKSPTVGYWLAVLGTVALLGSCYPWWAVLLASPVILIASLAFAGFLYVPLLIPLGIYQCIIDHIYAEERSGDRLPETKNRLDR